MATSTNDERAQRPSPLRSRSLIAARCESFGYHVTMRLVDDHGIARSPAALRQAARLFVRHGAARGLVAFRIADTHAHVLTVADRWQAGRFAQVVEAALSQALRVPVPFEPARFRLIGGPAHLWSALRYVLRQEARHGTGFDLAHDGSILPDLLGMRVIGTDDIVLRLGRLLPRLTAAELLDWVDGALPSDAPCDLDLAPDAAAAALALGSLVGRSPAKLAARRAAVHLFGRALTAGEIGIRLGISARRVEALRAESPARRILDAARRQLVWRTALKAKGLPAVR